MSRRQRRRRASALFGAALLGVALQGAGDSLSAADQKLDAALDRAGVYVADYEQKLSTLVAEERYEQELVSPDGSSSGHPIRTTRTLVSDYVMVRSPDLQIWSGFRDTFTVDGRPVRQRESRLEQLLAAGSSDAIEQAARLDEENARYNLGGDLIYRTINVPMLALEFLHPRLRWRFSFRKFRHDTIDGQAASAIDFVERGRPPLITTPAGPDQITRGTIWLDPQSGAVLKTSLNIVVTPASQAKIAVDYRLDAKMGLLVPSTMHEWYQQRRTTISTTATYTNFRRFETGARIVEPEK